MTRGIVEQIANSVLYEGYILYPYRPSALKNRQRWNFGGVCPRDYAEAHSASESCSVQTECLALGTKSTIRVRIRFLHLIERRAARLRESARELRDPADCDLLFVESLKVGERLYQGWQEAEEQGIDLPELKVKDQRREAISVDFHLPGSRDIELLRHPDGILAGVLIRQKKSLSFTAEMAIERLKPGLVKFHLEILNVTPCPGAARLSRDEAMLQSLVSTHAILEIRNGEFASLLEPPDEYAEYVAGCKNGGLYPVLAGEEGSRSTMLASPVILYDYPRVAPESAGDLFDGAEIDEILTLRILALSDEEKAEMRACDERARRILDRVESDPKHLAELHGAMRSIGKSKGDRHE